MAAAAGGGGGCKKKPRNTAGKSLKSTQVIGKKGKKKLVVLPGKKRMKILTE